MENQDQGKIHAPENHGGVHHCHKCGWLFPNPHPSARHRRAHKRVCGKIEGHKLIDLEGSNHSTISDDEHVSEDDNRSPSPVVVETAKSDNGIDESKEILKGSEDVFSDAGADFSGSKLAGNSKDSASISPELTSLQSFKDCEITDLVQLTNTLTDEMISDNKEVGHSAVEELEAGSEETRSEQSSNVPKDIYIDRENMNPVSNVAVQTNTPELKLEDIIERSSDPIETEEVVGLKEEHSACIDPNSEFAAKSCSSDYFVEIDDGGGEDRNEIMHTVSVLDDLNIDDHSQAQLDYFEDHKGGDEIIVREAEATEMKLIDSDNTKEEQEIDHIPKGSELENIVEDALPEGFDPSDISKENPDPKIEETKGLDKEHLPVAAEELPETDQKDIVGASESNTIVDHSNDRDGKMEYENSKPSPGPIADESLIHSSAVLTSEHSQMEGNNNVVDKPVVTGSPMDALADSSSQADSVEATWGSVLSGLSIRSDAQAAVEECKTIPQTFDHAGVAEKRDQKMQKVASQNSEKSDAFEPPSFSTLVEQGEGGGRSNAAESENQSTKEPQAGWFPSFTPAPSDFDGRKKNEELIAKVTNWKAGKQHTPLKNLLGEAALDAKLKSPNPENSTHPVQSDEKTTTKNGGTIKSGQGMEFPTTGEKEWDSPARLPEEIKEKKTKKRKGRPYWAQFVCCTSANY